MPATDRDLFSFLDRLGILFPVNAAAAQESDPTAPQVNPYDQRLAQHLSQLTGVIVSPG